MCSLCVRPSPFRKKISLKNPMNTDHINSLASLLSDAQTRAAFYYLTGYLAGAVEGKPIDADKLKEGYISALAYGSNRAR